MTDSRYKKYQDCNIDELEQIVNDLENMSHLFVKPAIVNIKREKKQPLDKKDRYNFFKNFIPYFSQKSY